MSHIVDDIIKLRKTEKVLFDAPRVPDRTPEELEELKNELLDLAAHAPYHYPSSNKHHGELASSLPFRFYTADANKCRSIATFAETEEIDLGKIQNMLFGADLLFLVTWLPDLFGAQWESANVKEPIPFTGNLRNMEHIAAASAAIQNVLLGATQRGLPNYWSSGGPLRLDPMRSHLNIPHSEILLGALFVFPQNNLMQDAAVVQGKLREVGKEMNTWSRKI